MGTPLGKRYEEEGPRGSALPAPAKHGGQSGGLEDVEEEGR